MKQFFFFFFFRCEFIKVKVFNLIVIVILTNARIRKEFFSSITRKLYTQNILGILNYYNNCQAEHFEYIKTSFIRLFNDHPNYF